MGNIKQINIKNKIYYFFDGIINIKNFGSDLLKIDIKIEIKILCIGIGEVDGYFEEINENKYKKQINIKTKKYWQNT